jgi:hypothetical protein
LVRILGWDCKSHPAPKLNFIGTGIILHLEGEISNSPYQNKILTTPGYDYKHHTAFKRTRETFVRYFKPNKIDPILRQEKNDN